MSERPEHLRMQEDLSAYALGALDEADAANLATHLADCDDCRRELAWMRVAVDTLPASVPQLEPPPELRARLMEIVTAEAEVLGAAGASADRPPLQFRRPRVLRRPRLAAGLCLAAAAVAAVALVLATQGTSTRTVSAELTGGLRGHASASLRLTGSRAQLVVAGLPAPPADHVDELWVQPPGRAPRPAGTFVVRTGAIDLASPVRSGDRVLVTVEPGAGTSAPTSAPILSVST